MGFNILKNARCELLQKVYLCSNTNNPRPRRMLYILVVNCFKKCIFAVIQTTETEEQQQHRGL